MPFSPTTSTDFIASSAPATGVDEEENESNNKNNDLGSKVAAKNAEELSKPNGKALKLATGIGKVTADDNINKNSDSIKIREKLEKSKHGNDPNKRKGIDKKEKTEQSRRKQKKREDETKLNNFLSKTEKKESGKLHGKIPAMDTNLEGNSTKNPPPFIRKHKVGKSEEARASELDDIYFLCEYSYKIYYWLRFNILNSNIPNILCQKYFREILIFLENK